MNLFGSGGKLNPVLICSGVILIVIGLALAPPRPRPPAGCSGSKTFSPILPPKPLAWSFVSQGYNLDQARVRVVTFNRQNTCRLIASLYSAGKPERLIAQAEASGQSAGDWQYLTFKFNSKTSLKGQKYKIVVASPNASVNNCLAVTTCPRGEHYWGDETRPGQPDIYFGYAGRLPQWRWLVVIGVIALAGGLLRQQRFFNALNLKLIALAGALQGISWLWVPPNRAPIYYGWNYYQTSLANGLHPRAVLGSIADLAQLSQTEYVLLIQGLVLIWLFLILKLLAGQWLTRSGGPISWTRLALIGLFFSFNQVVFWTSFFSGYTDVWSHVFILAALISLGVDQAPPKRAGLIKAWLWAGLALMNHEAAIFGLLIVALWVWLRRGWARAAAFFLPCLAFLVVYLAAIPAENIPAQRQAGAYLTNLGQIWQFVTAESGNLVGIFSACGFLWLLLIALIPGLIRSRTDRLRTAAWAAATWFTAAAPLAVAYDSSRVLSGFWLVGLIFMLQVDLPVWLDGSPIRRRAIVALAAAQLVWPPLGFFAQDVVPLNYYAQRIVGRLTAGSPNASFTALGGLIYFREHPSGQRYYQSTPAPKGVFR